MFETSFFADPGTLLLGALAGLIFGFLLHKGGVTRFEVIVNQFLLRDFTVLKVMGTAMLVGGIGVYAMLQLGWIGGLHVKAAYLLANAAGGLIFGVGMVVLGYCPGTAVGAAATGSRHAIPGLLGMLFGAAVYAEVYPWMKANVFPVGNLGKETLVTATGLSPWWYILALVILAVVGFSALQRHEAAQPVRH